MPMLDFQCANEECGREFESFFHPGKNPEDAPCPDCQTSAPRDRDLLKSLRQPARNALRFDPIALDRRMEAGEWVYSYPGSSSDPVAPGYERVYLTSISESDRHVKGVNEKEQELRSMNLQLEKQVWDERTKQRREDTRALIARRGFSGRYFDAICKVVDHKREKRYRELANRQVAFHNQAFSYDAGNRMAHCDQSTGWKDRK